MADQTHAADQTPITVESLLAERQSFWSSFTGAVTIATVAVVALVIAMAVFLV